MTGEELFAIWSKNYGPEGYGYSYDVISAAAQQGWKAVAAAVQKENTTPAVVVFSGPECIGHAIVRWLETCHPNARGSVAECLRSFADGAELDHE